MRLSRQIEKIEKKEKKAAFGRWRKGYCTEYVRLLKRTRSSARRRFDHELAEHGETITCRERCTHCCHHYLTVSLAQGIVIVDYLYRNRDIMRRFLGNYEQWAQRASELAAEIDGVRTQALASAVPIEQIIIQTRPLAERYFGAAIPCPFLVEDRCSIYSVRPTACSSHVAVSEPARCAADAVEKPDIRKVSLSDDELINLSRLADPRLMLFELTLPVMIFRLLTEGGETLMREV